MFNASEAEEFGNLYVTLSRHAETTTDYETAWTLHAKGAALYAGESHAIERIFADLGPSFMPRLLVYAREQDLPPELGKGPVRYCEEDGLIHTAVDSPVVKESLNRFFKNYLLSVDPEAQENETGHIRITEQDRIPNTENLTWGGSRYLYDPTTGPDTRYRMKNSRGDVGHFRHILPEERDFWIKYLFDNPADYTHYDFLRTLRLVNGLTQEQVSMQIGMTGNNVQIIENNRMPLPLDSCTRILDKNIFHFPEVVYTDPRGKEHTIIATHYSRLFSEKMGHATTLHSLPMQDQLWSALHAQHDAVRSRKLRWQDQPTARNIVRTLLRGDVDGFDTHASPVHLPAGETHKRIQHTISNAHNEYALYNALPQINERLGCGAMQLYILRTLPYRTREGNLRRAPKGQTVPPPTPNELLGIAREGTLSLGEFLNFYREETGQSTSHVEKRSHHCRCNTLKWEAKDELDAFALSKLIETNAYAFPTDKEGHVDPKVIEALHMLNGQAKEPALDKARTNTSTTGMYLARYREGIKRPQSAVANATGNTQRAVSQWESMERLPAATLENIIKINAYDLPTDTQGNIRTDVIADLTIRNKAPDPDREKALALARTSSGNLGTYLSHYREGIDRPQTSVAAVTGHSQTAVSHWELQSHIPDTTLNRIIATNAYDFPTDSTGSIRTDVIANLTDRNKIPEPSREDALANARKNSTYIGQYLQLYRQGMKHNAADVGTLLGIAERTVQSYESKSHLSPETIERITTSNGYNFPTELSGGLRSDVLQDIEQLNQPLAVSAPKGKPHASPDEAVLKARNEATDVGSYLHIYREALKQSHQQVADRAGRARSIVQKWEKKATIKPPVITHIIACNAYDFPVDTEGKTRNDVVDDLHHLNRERETSWQIKTAPSSITGPRLH